MDVELIKELNILSKALLKAHADSAKYCAAARDIENISRAKLVARQVKWTRTAEYKEDLHVKLCQTAARFLNLPDVEQEYQPIKRSF